MRTISLKRKGTRYIIDVVADGHIRQYIETDLEVAKARANKLKLILGIK